MTLPENAVQTGNSLFGRLSSTYLRACIVIFFAMFRLIVRILMPAVLERLVNGHFAVHI